MNEPLSSGILDLIQQGGFVMIPLILLSLILFTALFRLFFVLVQAWKIPHPALTPDTKTDEASNLEIDIKTLVRERAEWRLHFDRRLKFARIVTTTAPLLGLLGTVAGMLKTFSALGLREGLEAIDLVASGISEALITTETGLSIAIVGLFLLWAIRGFRRRLLLRFESREAAYELSRFQPDPRC